MQLKLMIMLAAAVLGVFGPEPGQFKAVEHAALKKIFEPAGSLAAGTSLNWSGYVASGQDLGAVTGTWKIPAVRGNKNFKTDAAWVGIGGVSHADLIQAGTEAVTGVPGKVGYLAWIELLPDYAQPVPLAVHKGDSVTVNIRHGAGAAWQIVLRNNSTGQEFSKQVSYQSSLSSAEWIEEMPSGADANLLPLDNFGAVNFSGCYVWKNGVKLSAGAAGSRPVVLVSQQHKILAEPLGLKSRGTAFAVKRLR